MALSYNRTWSRAIESIHNMTIFTMNRFGKWFWCKTLIIVYHSSIVKENLYEETKKAKLGSKVSICRQVKCTRSDNFGYKLYHSTCIIHSLISSRAYAFPSHCLHLKKE